MSSTRFFARPEPTTAGSTNPAKKNAERKVKAHHHRQCRILLRHDNQRIEASAKQQSHHDKHDLQRPFSMHGASSFQPDNGVLLNVF
ncbi:MAG TPA: hypothetical protein VF753_14760, partial [Terriglobales bacterium]